MVRLAATIALAFNAVTATVGNTQSLCPVDLSEISEPVMDGTIDKVQVKSIGVSFKPATVYIKSESGNLIPKEVVIPSVFVRLDSGFLSPFILKKIQDIVRGASVVAQLGIKHSEALNSQVFSNGVAKSAGSVKIWKDLSMTGFKCRWQKTWYGGYLRCERTTWSVRLFQKTFDWNASTSLTTKTGSPDGAAPDPLVPTSSRLAYDSVLDTGMNTEGKANIGSKNDFEKAVLAFASWFYSVIKDDVWDRWSFTALFPDLTVNKTKALDSREKLYPKNKSAIYRDASTFVGREGYRGFWYIFVDTLNFDLAQSGFKSSSAGNVLQVTYEQDNIRFAKRLTENRKGQSFIIDPFGRREFCRASTPNEKSTRDKIAEYLKEVVQQFEDQPQPEVFSGSPQSLSLRLRQKYGTRRIEPFLERHGYIKLNGSGGYEGKLPSVGEIADRKDVLLPWEHASGYSHYFSLANGERACVLRTLRSRHRSVNVVLPFDDLSSCFSDESVSPMQSSILESIKLWRMQHGETNKVVAGSIGDPVENMAYAGWHYCYRDPRLCTGQNNLFWYQKASEFGSRDGSQHGIDVIGDDFLSSTTVKAVAAGKVWFSNRDGIEWGNALILPFEVGEKPYYAIYAQLPSTSADLNQKVVASGETLGNTGCSGNAGNGLGECNAKCRWSGALRTDDHLHFEIITEQDGKFEHVDPLVMLASKPTSDNRSVYIYCEN